MDPYICFQCLRWDTSKKTIILDTLLLDTSNNICISIYNAWAPMSPYKCNSQLNPKKTDVSQHEFGSKKVIKALMQAQYPVSHKHKAQNLKLEMDFTMMDSLTILCC